MTRRSSQAGLTLIEVMIASAVLVMMMTLAWRTIRNTSDVRQSSSTYQERNHELRMALGRAVADFEAAYLSKNEDPNASHPRTLMVAKAGSKVAQISFSTLGHRVLWSDANESEQTVVTYMAHDSKEHPGQTDWVRAERRRPSNEVPEDEPAEFDVLCRNVEKVEIQFWNWKNLEWQDTWDTTQADGQRGWLPSRVKITLTVKGADDQDIKFTTQARIVMQEPLLFSPT
ncbi:MAG TPA: type II secretion system protein GspJ [Kofleriaceae bacterium]|nr:type II secretion system protein GspJ [Kofleriaceae bacterium]